MTYMHARVYKYPKQRRACLHNKSPYLILLDINGIWDEFLISDVAISLVSFETIVSVSNA